MRGDGCPPRRRQLEDRSTRTDLGLVLHGLPPRSPQRVRAALAELIEATTGAVLSTLERGDLTRLGCLLEFHVGLRILHDTVSGGDTNRWPDP